MTRFRVPEGALQVVCSFGAMGPFGRRCLAPNSEMSHVSLAVPVFSTAAVRSVCCDLADYLCIAWVPLRAALPEFHCGQRAMLALPNPRSAADVVVLFVQRQCSRSTRCSTRATASCSCLVERTAVSRCGVPPTWRTCSRCSATARR